MDDPGAGERELPDLVAELGWEEVELVESCRECELRFKDWSFGRGWRGCLLVRLREGLGSP